MDTGDTKHGQTSYENLDEMKQIEINSNSDGIVLKAIAIEAAQPKGTVQIVHGMCEHKERYIPFMEFLAAHGYNCICHDHRGHGGSVKSPEDLGFMYSGGWRAMVDDARLVGQRAKAEWPGLPLYLFGHSMGSMVVRSFTKRYDDEIDGLFVCGCPSKNAAAPLGRLLAKLAGLGNGGRKRPALLQAMSLGSFNKNFESEGKNAWVCSDAEALALYNADPLCQFQFTANGFDNLLGLSMDCYCRKGWAMKNPKLPVRFISGGDDPCRISDKDLDKAVAMMMAVGYGDVELTVYDGMRHEILNETDKAEVWNNILCELDGWTR